MRCPVCKNPMMVVEHQQIELDYCLECRGIWFDATELELLFDAFDLGDEFDLEQMTRPAPDHVAEAKRKCPICGKRMQKVLLGQDPGVLVDKCPRGHGLWFDGGELGTVIRRVLATPGAEGRVITFLGETFAAPSQGAEAKGDLPPAPDRPEP